MSSYVSAALRRLVAVRADALCEYCLMHEDDAVFGCEFDHIISEKHGGATDAENLAYACAFCNRAKGSDRVHRAAHGTLRPIFQSTHRERCRPDALLIRGETVQSKDFFANKGQ